MENIIFIVHLLVALAIIGLILMQQGKGAEMGASFGAGASQTLFGSGGSGNFFSRMTALLVAVFFITSFALAIIAKKQADITEDVSFSISEEVELPSLEETAPIDASDVPSVDIEAEADSSEDVPELPAE
ncbi:preprotein translocase subunit SecG [Saccharophagus degradans]|uniref:Protein-export membrane protein SecG n=2 Tax=Saccharophagus degradans TaxID=86304 RepID=Q21H53_SACD2|nr:preprotein translocase subunit SecG [Saccharophagus degradans]ABD81976.1 protein translocase subunit secG [Saccharophagus degradans 2-40]MBU2987757.1 preprotein translocase subunit SecG [Saccharophagus degradans]MDO6422494.1 preprotein translocase subunit SecG [Saccharophagus degradans]MDO6606975.1 preprotein translocase subunit SecG [Saccharophagus degradans]WGO99821.1 preprotein translocase subunit SecG [Saccharophagus degradans]